MSNSINSFFAIATEASLTVAERKAIPDKLFGLPMLRKYPLDTEERLRKAIQFFHYCKEENRKELANNIIKRMKALHLDIEFSEKSLVRKYASIKP